VQHRDFRYAGNSVMPCDYVMVVVVVGLVEGHDERIHNVTMEKLVVDLMCVCFSVPDC